LRHCLLLDLRDDPTLIAEYEARHRAIWPEVALHLRTQGVTAMQIYRLGTRLCMVMDTDDAVFDAERMAKAAASDPRLIAWEEEMWRYQLPTPWTPAGAKWVAAECIFDLARQRQAGAPG
jgi:L-rhamnose mutarotase